MDPELAALLALSARHSELHLQRTPSGWAMMSYIPNGKSRTHILDRGDGPTPYTVPDYDVVIHATAPTLAELNSTTLLSDDISSRL